MSQEAFAQKLFEAWALEQQRTSGSCHERWTALDPAAQGAWLAAARVWRRDPDDVLDEVRTAIAAQCGCMKGDCSHDQIRELVRLYRKEHAIEEPVSVATATGDLAEEHAVLRLEREVEGLQARQQELLATIVRLTNETPFPDEIAGWQAQRAAMLVEIGTLKAGFADLGRDNAGLFGELHGTQVSEAFFRDRCEQLESIFEHLKRVWLAAQVAVLERRRELIELCPDLFEAITEAQNSSPPLLFSVDEREALGVLAQDVREVFNLIESPNGPALMRALAVIDKIAPRSS